MFSTICPRVYQRLRERSGLSQSKLGKAIGGSRHSVYNFESGKSRPDAAQEIRLLETTNCSKLEFAEMVCEELSELIGAPVGIREQNGYEPSLILTDAHMVLRQRAEKVPAGLAHALNRKVLMTRLLSLIFEFNNTDLEELIQSCNEELEQKRRDGSSCKI